VFGCIEEQEPKNGGFRSKITKLERGSDVSNAMAKKLILKHDVDLIKHLSLP